MDNANLITILVTVYVYKIVFQIAKCKLVLQNAVHVKIPSNYQLMHLLAAYLHNVLCVIQLLDLAAHAQADFMSTMVNVFLIH